MNRGDDGDLASGLDQLDLIDAYRLLEHERIGGHGPAPSAGGLPAARRLALVSATPMCNEVVVRHYRRA